MNKVVFCMDSKTKEMPNIIGLSNSDFSNNNWLELFTDAQKFRDQVKQACAGTEVWVYSSDEVDAINIAATCKHERQDLVVLLVSLSLSGSLKSRASSAGIDAVINQYDLKNRFLALQNCSNDKKSVNVNSKINTEAIAPTGKKAFLLPIVSASGGSGKSTVSILSSVLCQFSGYKTLLLDADLQFGDCANKFDSANIVRIDQLISEPDLISDLEPKNNLPVIVGCPKLPELAPNVMKELPNLISRLSYMFDVIIVNTGSFWDEQHAMLLEQCSCCLMLLSQTPSSIASTKKALNLYHRCNISTASIIFGINFCNKQSIYTSVDISCALDGVSVAEISDGGLEVDEFLSSKNPVGLLKEKNPATLSIWNILERILPQRKSLNQNNDYSAKTNTKQRKFKLRRRA